MSAVLVAIGGKATWRLQAPTSEFDAVDGHPTAWTCAEKLRSLRLRASGLRLMAGGEGRNGLIGRLPIAAISSNPRR